MIKMSCDQISCTENGNVIDIQTCSFMWLIKRNELVKEFTFPKNSRFKVTAMSYSYDMNFTVQLVSPKRLNGYMKGSIKILNELDEETDISEAENYFDLKNGIFFQNRKWLSEQGEPYDSYKLLCEFVISSDEFENKYNLPVTESSLTLSESTTLNVALKDFLTMYDDKKMTDLILQSDDGTFHAHKFVLGARSPVFSSMFSHDMIDVQSNVVKISDIDSEILHCLLTFMYGGMVENLNYEKATGLLIAADKYIIPSLKHLCSSFLRKIVGDYNVCKLILLADAVQDENLKLECITYIISDIKNVLRSPEWKQLQERNMKLATEILTQHALET